MPSNTVDAENATSPQSWDARLYEDKHSFVWKQGASLLDLLAPQPGEHILDLGCGTGHLTAQIAALGATVVGIDHSREMIDQAHGNYPDLRLEVGDARALPYDAAFEAVFSNAVLHWIVEADQVVRAVARALKPGGRFVAEFGGKGNVRASVAAMQKAAAALGCEAGSSPWYFPSVAEYAVLLEHHGMEVTFATLFDRLTPLEGEAGLRHWVEMFGGPFLACVGPERREDFFRRTEDLLRPILRREEGWVADYRRLRVVAYRTTTGRA